MMSSFVNKVRGPLGRELKVYSARLASKISPIGVLKVIV
jgi:hypothetical protein